MVRRKKRVDLLPADDVAPLVDQHRQVAPGLDPLGVHRPDDRLGGRADREPLGQLLVAALGDPGHLGREAGDVLGLLAQEALRDEQREVGVLVAGRLEAARPARSACSPRARSRRGG